MSGFKAEVHEYEDLLPPIGVIHTPFHDPVGMPVQPVGEKEIAGTVEVYPEFTDGLMDIEGFSRIILTYDFHLSGDCRLQLVYISSRGRVAAFTSAGWTCLTGLPSLISSLISRSTMHFSASGPAGFPEVNPAS